VCVCVCVRKNYRFFIWRVMFARRTNAQKYESIGYRGKAIFFSLVNFGTREIMRRVYIRMCTYEKRYYYRDQGNRV